MLDTSKVYTSKVAGEFKIVNYVNCKNIEIEFTSTKTRRVVTSDRIKGGKIKDPLFPSVYGLGFIGVGDYKSRVGGIKTAQYRAWSCMMARCYGESTQKRQPTYKGCTVCEEWHDFQVFSKWFDENYVDGYQLDKDIKAKGNKIYSPENCCFVSQAVNVSSATSKKYTLISPSGEVIKGENLFQFSKANKLSVRGMYRMTRGITKGYKGWTKVEN